MFVRRRACRLLSDLLCLSRASDGVFRSHFRHEIGRSYSEAAGAVAIGSPRMVIEGVALDAPEQGTWNHRRTARYADAQGDRTRQVAMRRVTLSGNSKARKVDTLHAGVQ